MPVWALSSTKIILNNWRRGKELKWQNLLLCHLKFLTFTELHDIALNLTILKDDIPKVFWLLRTEG